MMKYVVAFVCVLV